MPASRLDVLTRPLDPDSGTVPYGEETCVDYGIAFPSYVDAWRDVAAAEAAGFTHAWFFDSQLLYSDVYATMALAAQHSSRIILGTLVAIPSNRIPAVTASAVATINYLAPGRVILGLGTGNTGRNAMGLPAVPIAEFREYTQQVRGLLQGDEVLIREGERERWIRLLHPDRGGFININDAIPIYLAATGPKALAATGELADGWVRNAFTPQLASGFEAIRAAAAAVGRPTDKLYTVGLTGGCVLRAGESLMSPRVIERVGPAALGGTHGIWESQYGLGASMGLRDPDAAAAYHRYIEEYGDARGSKPDRRYLDVHTGHMVFLKPEEDQFIDETKVGNTLTGTPAQIIDRLEQLEAAGIDNIAIACMNAAGARELVADFGREVIAKRSHT